jgi:hypothetical protein
VGRPAVVAEGCTVQRGDGGVELGVGVIGEGAVAAISGRGRSVAIGASPRLRVADGTVGGVGGVDSGWCSEKESEVWRAEERVTGHGLVWYYCNVMTRYDVYRSRMRAGAGSIVKRRRSHLRLSPTTTP